jgi:hypothetical protein
VSRVSRIMMEAEDLGESFNKQLAGREERSHEK